MSEEETDFFFFFSLSDVFITCLKSSPGPGWLSKVASYLTLGQETSCHLAEVFIFQGCVLIC